MFPAILTSLLFACSGMAGRRLPQFFSSTQANFFRLLLAGSLLGTCSLALGAQFHEMVFPLLFLSGCVGFGLSDMAMLQTYPHLGARRTMVMVQCVAVPLATLIEWAWLGHAPTLGEAGFAIMVLVGVGLAMLPSSAAEPTHGLAVGIGFGLLAALGQAGGAVISRKAYAVAMAAGQPFHGALDGLTAAFERMLGGLFITLLVWCVTEATRRNPTSRPGNWRAGGPWLIANALLGPSLGVTCFQWALMTEKTSVVLPIVATSPLLVIPLTRWVDGEGITWRAVGGGIIAVGGVIGLTLAK